MSMSAEKPLSTINFFICSTYVDLKPYRDAVIKNLQSHAAVISAQEFFGARDQKPLATCLEEVDKSDVFVMFLGPNYGSIDQGSNKSFVECEYARAKEKTLPRFAYLIDDSYSFPIKYVSKGEDAKRLIEFKNAVKNDLTVDFFTSPEDLAKKVYGDLVRELPKHGFKLGTDEKDEDQSAVGILTRFIALPKLFHGRDVTFRAKLGSYDRANENICNAFSYRYGAAVVRTFTPVNKDLGAICTGSLRKIFATDEKALELIEVPEGEEIEILAKTKQGEYTIDEPIYEREDPPQIDFRTHYVFVSGPPPRKQIIVGHKQVSTLICGLELIEFRRP